MSHQSPNSRKDSSNILESLVEKRMKVKGTIMWVKMSDLDNYQWAFNHRHLIEGIFYTYVDYEEIEGLDDLFAE